jgi:hypothetical protein
MAHNHGKEDERMNPRTVRCLLALLATIAGAAWLSAPVAPELPAASLADPSGPPMPYAPVDNANPPTETAKLIFVHHSCGENWLADGNGGLGLALRQNNYFVSDTNYGWGPACPDCGDCPGSGPDHIGNCTDILHWDNWFAGPHSNTYLNALYTEYGQHAGYSRLASDPGGENEIILFKSCYPNSNLGGNPDDPPEPPGEWLTVGGAKHVYLAVRDHFQTRRDKLFVVITAPPVTPGDGWEPPANARAFNNWLVEDWLDDYPYDNVTVFDFYNVLTSNGGDAGTSDAGWETGNHHRWWPASGNGQVQHLQTVDNDLAAYPTGDSHPAAAGNQKATAELVPLLNVFYHRWQTSAPPAPEPDHWVHLPLILSDWAASTAQPPDPPIPPPMRLAGPADLAYCGAFRLPERAAGAPDEEAWEWGGQAFAYRPVGDPHGAADGHPGSLLGTGHAVYNYVSEVDIPPPSLSRSLSQLPVARTLQPFSDVRAGLFDGLTEIPRVGLETLPAQGAQASDKLYLAWGQHLQLDEATIVPSHAWCDLDLSRPDTQGAWWIGDESPFATNGYLFAIPEAWARQRTGGRMLATGRFRDGGWSGMGPSLFAYGPWLDGSPPAPGTHLSARPLLLYSNTRGADQADFRLEGYHHADEWEGGAWLTTPDGRSAVLFAGTKGSGYCWYGWASPGGDGRPCVEGGVSGYTTCYTPEGSACPPGLAAHCEEGSSHSYRGWWSSRFDALILFYDPEDLARVAGGSMAPHEPQPYATLDLDEHLFLGPSPEPMSTGSGDQRRGRIGEMAYDRERGFLYVPEYLADGARPVIHVWSVR